MDGPKKNLMDICIPFRSLLKRTYSNMPNKRTVSNNRTGCYIRQKLISAQCLISAQALIKPISLIR